MWACSHSQLTSVLLYGQSFSLVPTRLIILLLTSLALSYVLSVCICKHDIITTKSKGGHRNENKWNYSLNVYWKDCLTTGLWQPFPVLPCLQLSFPANLTTQDSSSLVVVVRWCGAVDGGWIADGVEELWKTKPRQRKTGNSMSSGLRADGREAGGRGRGMGPYLPWSLSLGP